MGANRQEQVTVAQCKGLASRVAREESVRREQRALRMGVTEARNDEHSRRTKADLAEVYSPRKVTATGARMAMRVGDAMDLTIGWDFRRRDHQEEAWNYVRTYPPC